MSRHNRERRKKKMAEKTTPPHHQEAPFVDITVGSDGLPRFSTNLNEAQACFLLSQTLLGITSRTLFPTNRQPGIEIANGPLPPFNPLSGA